MTVLLVDAVTRDVIAEASQSGHLWTLRCVQQSYRSQYSLVTSRSGVGSSRDRASDTRHAFVVPPLPDATLPPEDIPHPSSLREANLPSLDADAHAALELNLPDAASLPTDVQELVSDSSVSSSGDH